MRVTQRLGWQGKYLRDGWRKLIGKWRTKEEKLFFYWQVLCPHRLTNTYKHESHFLACQYCQQVTTVGSEYQTLLNIIITETCLSIYNNILKCLDKNIDYKINMLLAMKFGRRALYTVSNVTVKNCFKKAGFWTGAGPQDFKPKKNEVEVRPSNKEWAKLVSHEITMSIPTFEDFLRGWR